MVLCNRINTVDGSEIRRSPVEAKVVYPSIYTIPGGAGFQPSTVGIDVSITETAIRPPKSVAVDREETVDRLGRGNSGSMEGLGQRTGFLKSPVDQSHLL